MSSKLKRLPAFKSTFRRIFTTTLLHRECNLIKKKQTTVDRRVQDKLPTTYNYCFSSVNARAFLKQLGI